MFPGGHEQQPDPQPLEDAHFDIFDKELKKVTFRAVLVSQQETGLSAEVTTLADDALMNGEVTVPVDYSTVNYKDRLTVTGRAPIHNDAPIGRATSSPRVWLAASS